MNIECNPNKNELLKSTRNVSFEMVLKEISEGAILEDNLHPNQNILLVK